MCSRFPFSAIASYIKYFALHKHQATHRFIHLRHRRWNGCRIRVVLGQRRALELDVEIPSAPYERMEFTHSFSIRTILMIICVVVLARPILTMLRRYTTAAPSTTRSREFAFFRAFIQCLKGGGTNCGKMDAFFICILLLPNGDEGDGQPYRQHKVVYDFGRRHGSGKRKYA